MTKEDGDRITRAADYHLSNNKANIRKDENERKKPEVNVLHSSPQPPVNKLLVPSLDWWPSWIIPLRDKITH